MKTLQRIKVANNPWRDYCEEKFFSAMKHFLDSQNESFLQEKSIFDLGVINSEDKKKIRFNPDKYSFDFYYDPHYGRCHDRQIAISTYACSKDSKSIAFLFKVQEETPLFITLDGKTGLDYDLYLAPAVNGSPKRISNSVAYAVNSSQYIGTNDVIFSDLEPGEYYLEVRLNEGAVQESSDQSFTIKFDPKSFVVNTEIPDDTYFNKQWSLYGNPRMAEILSDQNFSYILPNYDVGGPEAWKYSQKAGDVVVAVMDTGVDIQHPDLDDNIWINPNINKSKYRDDINGWNFYDNNNDISDYGSHGTHVAGIIAAEWGNQMGIAGVAPNAKIMPLKAGMDSTFGQAIRYAVDNGAKVVNYSQGKYLKLEPDRVYEFLNYDGQLLDNAPDIVRQLHENYFVPLEYARKNSVNVVFAGGNENSFEETLYGWEDAGNAAQTFAPSVGFAKYFDNAINVGASNAMGEAASYSNYGGLIDIYAPGGDSSSSFSQDTQILSTVPSSMCTGEGNCIYEENNLMTKDQLKNESSSFYGFSSGTSMAAPVVSGSIAFLRGLYPCMSAAEVNQLILDTAFENHKITTESGEAGKMLGLGSAANFANAINNNPRFKLGKECKGKKYFAASNTQPISEIIHGFVSGTLRDDIIRPQNQEQSITIFSLDGDDKIDLRKFGSSSDSNYISGGVGSDTIICSDGVDQLVYNGTAESNLASADIVVDFGSEDQINLSNILADSVGKPEFIAAESYKIFTANEIDRGKLRPQIRASKQLVGIDENGDGISEFRLFFDKPLDFDIDQSNFIL